MATISQIELPDGSMHDVKDTVINTKSWQTMYNDAGHVPTQKTYLTGVTAESSETNSNYYHPNIYIKAETGSPSSGGILYAKTLEASNVNVTSSIKCQAGMNQGVFKGYYTGSSDYGVEMCSSAGDIYDNPYFRVTTTNSYLYVPAFGTGTTATYLRIKPSTGELTVTTSSKRYKDNLNYDFDKEKLHNQIMNLKPCIFNYKTDDPKYKNFSLIAEDVDEVAPFFAQYNQDNLPENYDERGINTALIAEVQYKEKQIQELKSEINDLKTRLSKLEEKFN